MTDKVSFIEIIAGEETQTHAIIEHEDGSFTSMPKSHYDEMIAKQDEAKTK